MSATDDELMRVLEHDETYVVVRTLADGPRGITQLVRAPNDARPLVRKLIPRDLANRRAWEAARKIACPRLPQVVDLYELPDMLVVVYEFVPGRSARTLVEERGWLSPSEAVPLVRDLCEAATSFHAVGVVHRDITPGNVIVAADGAHLIDLGIARTLNEGAMRDTTALGTYGFAAPEQFGFAQTDARSDVYALGRLLGYLLIGLYPDDSAYGDALSDGMLVPPMLGEIINKASAFAPAERFQSATEMASALDALRLRDEPVARELPCNGSDERKESAGYRVDSSLVSDGVGEGAPHIADGDGVQCQASRTGIGLRNALWLAGGVLLALLFVAGGLKSSVQPASYKVATVILGLLCALLALAYPVERIRRDLRMGGYAEADDPAALLKRRMRQAVMLVLAGFFVLCFVAAIVNRGTAVVESLVEEQTVSGVGELVEPKSVRVGS